MSKKEKYIVSQKKNGKEYLTVKFHYKQNGEDRQYTKTFSVSDFSSRAKAMQAACDHRDLKRAELLTIGLPSGTKRTVSQCFNDYIRMYHVTQGTQKKLQTYFNHLTDYQNRYVDEITPLDIQNSLYGLRYTMSDDALSRIRLVWSDIMKVALKLGLISQNPLDKVDMPKSKKISNPRNQAVSDTDIATMIHYFETYGKTEEGRYNNKLIAGMIIVMSETGMRPAECCALTRSDLDFLHKTISITKSLGSSEDEENTVTQTKTFSSIRKIPMTQRCEATFTELLGMSANDFIFAQWNGKLPDTRKISLKVKVAADKLGIDFHLYMLRHRFSTKLITNGVDVRTIMELMGHTNATMTISYARSDEEKKKKAIELV